MPKIDPQASKRIDEHIEDAPEFAKPILRRIRAIIHRADARLVEDWKWGPNYYFKGMVCGFGAFKAHVSLAFFKGALLSDPKGILIDCSGSNVHNRTLKFRSLAELDEKTVLAYVKEAVKINERGEKIAAKKKAVRIPPDLGKALAAAPKARANFDAMAPGYRSEYVEYLQEAKRPETRRERLKKTVDQLARNLTLHWKYK